MRSLLHVEAILVGNNNNPAALVESLAFYADEKSRICCDAATDSAK